MDRKKIIRAAKCCVNASCKHCPYNERFPDMCKKMLMMDFIDFLAEIAETTKT